MPGISTEPQKSAGLEEESRCRSPSRLWRKSRPGESCDFFVESRRENRRRFGNRRGFPTKSRRKRHARSAMRLLPQPARTGIEHPIVLRRKSPTDSALMNLEPGAPKRHGAPGSNLGDGASFIVVFTIPGAAAGRGTSGDPGQRAWSLCCENRAARVETCTVKSGLAPLIDLCKTIYTLLGVRRDPPSPPSGCAEPLLSSRHSITLRPRLGAL